MKKILLTLGSMAAIAAPVATAISCGQANDVLWANQELKSKYILSKENETAIKNAGIQALSIPSKDMHFPFGGIGFKIGKLHFHYYAKIIFDHDSSFDAGNGPRAVKAQSEILIGVNEPNDHRTASASNMKVFYITENNFTEDLTPTLIAKNKMAIIESAMNKALVEIKEKEAKEIEQENNWIFMSDISAIIVKDNPTKARVVIMKVGPGARKPTHIPNEDIEPVIEELKKLPGIEKVTEIQCFYTSAGASSSDVELFVIKVPAGHATDFKAVSEAAATTVATVTSPRPSTSGTQTPASGSQPSNNAPQ